jgi:hypothetical protein
MSVEATERTGGSTQQETARLLRLTGSAVPLGTVWYADDTSRLLRRLAQQPVCLPSRPGRLPRGLIDRLASGMSEPEFLAFLADVVEEVDGESLPDPWHMPMSPGEARIRYPLLSRTRPGTPPRSGGGARLVHTVGIRAEARHSRADLHAEIRHAEVFLAGDDVLRDNLGHTVDGVCSSLLNAWLAVPAVAGAEVVDDPDAPDIPGAPGGEAASTDVPAGSRAGLSMDGVPAALLTLCAHEAELPEPDLITAVTRFLRLAEWGAPLGPLRRTGDFGHDLRRSHLLPEGPYARLAGDLFSRRLPHTPGDPERVAFLTSFADEVDELDGSTAPGVWALPISPWEARHRYPSIAGITFVIEYGDRPTLAANLTEKLESECYAGCRMELAQLLAEIVHARAFFDSEDSLRENLSGEFSWISAGALDEVEVLAEEHVSRCHPPT